METENMLPEIIRVSCKIFLINYSNFELCDFSLDNV